jgi:protein-disulfide isomerase
MNTKIIRTVVVLAAIVITILLAVISPRLSYKKAVQEAYDSLPTPLPTKVLATLKPTDHRRGPADAAITVVEYSDLECPFCQKAHPVVKQLLAQNPNVAWVYRHYPLPNHKGAYPKALLAECVGIKQGNEGFWKVVDGFMGHLDTPAVLKSVGLTQSDLTECIADPKTAAIVDADVKEAITAETKGTPNFVIIGSHGEQVPIPGAPKLEILQAIVNKMMSETPNVPAQK